MGTPRTWQTKKVRASGMDDHRADFVVGAVAGMRGAGGGYCDQPHHMGGVAATEPTAVPTEAATPANTTAPSKQPSTSTTAAASAGHYKQTKAKEWGLLLVNSWNTLPDGYEQATTYVDYDNAGNRIDTRIKDALDQMMSDGEEYGLWGVLLYRDGETQQQYFDAAVKEWKAKGYSDSTRVRWRRPR